MKNILLFFGGSSSEYAVSLKSASAIIKAIDKDKYNLYQVGITKEGAWYLYNGDIDLIANDKWQIESNKKCFISMENDKCLSIINDNNIENIHIDIAFPVLHGKNGEDGTIQGLLKLAGIPIVGCDIYSSAICMDKEFSHILVESKVKGIAKTPFVVLDSIEEYEEKLSDIKKLGYPMYVKPSKGGSSIGITKVKDESSILSSVKEAFNYDNKVIIEAHVEGIEIGVSVMGNKNLVVGEVDAVKLDCDFFGYEEKYVTLKSEFILPAPFEEDVLKEIKRVGLASYKALGCSGFARVDLFYGSDKKIYFNEINTIPGFTFNSRFPRMLKHTGYTFEEIVEYLIKESLN